MATHFSDTFDRADSSSVGGSWTERDASGILSINSNKLRLNSSADVNADLLVAATHHKNIKISFTLEVITRGDGNGVAIGSLGASGGGGGEYRNSFGVTVFPRTTGGFQFMDGTAGFEGTMTSFTFSASTTYNVELMIFEDYSREVRIWAVGGNRPAAPTGRTAPKTPTATGTNYKIGYDNGGTSAGDHKVNDFLVESVTDVQCLDLESSSTQYAGIGDGSQTGLDLTGNHTLMGWFKLEAQPSSATREFFSKHLEAGNQRGFLYRYEDAAGTKRFECRTSADGTGAGGTTVGTTNYTLPVGVWFHIAFVYNTAGTIDIYVNGKNIGQQTGHKTSIFNNTADFRIGNSADGGSWDGYVKYCKAFNDNRSASEIASDAHSATVTDANLQGEWSFNNVYTDTSGNGNTLTASGSPVFVYDTPWIAPSGIENSVFLLNQLLAYWTMDEASGTREDSHNSNDLTDNNTVTSAAGKKSNAADFEATNTEYLSITSAENINITGELSISFWVNFESLPSSGNNMWLFDKKSEGSAADDYSVYAIYLNNTTGTYQLRLRTTNGSSASLNDQSVTWAPSTATWYNIVITRSATGEISFYANGVLLGTASGYSGALSGTAADNFFLGIYKTTDARAIDGLVDEAAIHARLLSYGDVLDLYNAGNAIGYTGATNITVTPSAQVVTSSIPAYSVLFDRVVAVAAQVATFSLPSRTISLPKTVTPSVQTATFSIPVFTIDAGGNITVAVGAQTATFSIPAFSILKGWVQSVSAVVATFSTPATTIATGTGVVVAAVVQTVTVTIPAYTVIIVANITVSVNAVVATFVAPTIAKVGAIWRKVARSTDAVWSRVSRNNN